MVYLDRAVGRLRAQGGIGPDESSGSRRPARMGAHWTDRGLRSDRARPRRTVSPATRGSYYVPGAGGLACSFEQIVRRPQHRGAPKFDCCAPGLKKYACSHSVAQIRAVGLEPLATDRQSPFPGPDRPAPSAQSESLGAH